MDEPQTIDMMAFHAGGMEEFGGGLYSLNVVQNEQGKWVGVNIQPLSTTAVKYLSYQPTFVNTDQFDSHTKPSVYRGCHDPGSLNKSQARVRIYIHSNSACIKLKTHNNARPLRKYF